MQNTQTYKAAKRTTNDLYKYIADIQTGTQSYSVHDLDHISDASLSSLALLRVSRSLSLISRHKAGKLSHSGKGG